MKKTTVYSLTMAAMACAALALPSAALAQQQVCTKIGFAIGAPNPNRCATLVPANAPALQATAKPEQPAEETTAAAATPPLLPPEAQQANEILSNQLSTVRKQAFSGIAQAAALAPLLPSGVGKTTANIGAAAYAGHAALGVSIAHRPAQNLVFSAGLSLSSSGTSLVRLGAGFEF